MEKEDRETLNHMSNTLDKILSVLLKPENIFVRVFEIGAAGVGILGILGIVDIIKSWIGG